MNDQQLLELAAKAANLSNTRYVYKTSWGTGISHGEGDQVYHIWNPLKDDGDALRLAIQLGLFSDKTMKYVWGDCMVDVNPIKATRRAIVRAAAQLALNNE